MLINGWSRSLLNGQAYRTGMTEGRSNGSCISWYYGLQDLIHMRGVRRAEMDLLLDVLDDKPARWQEQRDQLAELLL